MSGLNMHSDLDINIAKSKLVEAVLERIQEDFGLSAEDIKKTIAHKEKEDTFPLSILKDPSISNLEAIVKYLRENKNKSYKEIGILLNRGPKTLATTYFSTKQKKSEKFESKIENDENKIPFKIFLNKLSVLEAICTYFKEQGLKNVEIAKLLNKDQKTIWTVCNRASKKSGGVNK